MAAALGGTIISIPVSAAIKFLIPELPFLDQMLLSFTVVALAIIAISLIGKMESKGLEFSRNIFRTDKWFNLFSIIILIIFSAIYILFW